jgi:hypothetical protein
MMNNDDTDWLREQMARVRNHLADDVVEVVEQAKELTDWRSYVRRHPWMCVGAAAAIGFMMVPVRRRAAVASTRNLAEPNGYQATGAMSDDRPASTRSASTMQPLINLAAGLAVRRLVSIAGNQLQNMLVSRANSANPDARRTPPNPPVRP